MANFLTKKIGPLPIWAYGAIAAGGTFLLLSSGGGGKKKKKGSDSGNTNSSTSDSTGQYSIKESINSDQTFGGGGIGFFGRPFDGGGRNIFMNFHHHPDGGYYHGGRNYDARSFRRHGFHDGGTTAHRSSVLRGSTR